MAVVRAHTRTRTEIGMRKERLAFVLLALISAEVWAQQAEPVPQPMQTTTKNPQVSQENEPQLSEQDKDMACHIGMDTGPGTYRIYTVGGSVRPPKPTNEVSASFSNEARKMAKKMHLKNFQAISLVTLIVDSQGNPQAVCIQKPAGYGLDGQAVRAVQKYHFEPATLAGTPVPVRIVVEVNFRLY